jgi:hypothetical protein
VTAKGGPWREMGYAGEQELAIFVPVRRQGQALPSIYTPYIFVDNPTAVSQGREIYGFPKELARFDRFGDSTYRVAVHGIDKFDPASKVDWRDLLELERVGVMRGPADQEEWHDYDEAALALNRSAEDLLDHRGIPPFGRDDQWPPRGSMLFLKQFFEESDGRMPCYQAVVGADVKLIKGARFYGKPLLERWRLKVHDLESHPLCRHLGLASREETSLAYRMELNFEMTAGQALWSSCGEANGQRPARRRGVR